MPKTKLFISSINIKKDDSITSKSHFLDTNDILIYTIYLPDFIELKSDLNQFLNSDEIIRADRFHKQIDRDRFIISRSILKLILAAHTQLAVTEIYLDYHSNKKPYLASHPWLNFNISHSHEYVAIAISRKVVGIDIEYLSDDFDFTNLLPDIFNANEILNIDNAKNKKHAFYKSWTRKEAFAKALGKGIDEEFLYIPCLDGEHDLDDILLKNNKNWQIHSFDLTNQYPIAICFEGLHPSSKDLKFYSVPNIAPELLNMIKQKI